MDGAMRTDWRDTQEVKLAGLSDALDMWVRCEEGETNVKDNP